ncbi:hypothetical protein [Aliamphritea spongicola]|nr:hypothetical protein [Aliamphritea spongicola]
MVFELTLNDAMDTYTYQQYVAIETEVSATVGQGLSGNNSASSLQTSSGLNSDPVETTFYGYEFNGNQYVRSTVDTSANTMGVGAGQDIDADFNREDHLFMRFDQDITRVNVQVDVVGSGLTILRYTVYSVTPAVLAQLGQDGFSYADLPPGETRSMVVTDGQMVEIKASSAGLTEFSLIVFESDIGAYKLVPDTLTVDYLSEDQDFSLKAPIRVVDSDSDAASDAIDINISGTMDTLTGSSATDALGAMNLPIH